MTAKAVVKEVGSFRG